MTSYRDIIQKLFTLQTRVRGKLGLENIQLLCNAFDNPQNRFKSIHVAGTNGKGSVSTMIAKSLQLSSKKVGLYTSPHIATFRERIVINGELISEEDVCKHLQTIEEKIEPFGITPSFFEIVTLLGFIYFAENNVDYAVFETGLGGRCDATNVIHPELSVITSISYDHTEQLGSTLEKITREKAGIIKPGIPVVIGPTVDKSLISEYTDRCTAVEGLFPSYKEENTAVAAVAMQFLKIEPHIIEQAIHALPPCRFEKREVNGREVIFDVAHNTAGFQKLSELLMGKYEVVIAVSATKDLSGLEYLLPFAKNWHLVEAPNGRSYSPWEVQAKILGLGVSSDDISLHGAIPDALHKALNFSNLPVLICGSFFIMGEARRFFNLHDPADFLDTNEKQLPTA